MYKFVKIAHDVEQNIRTAVYKEGEKLPSIRAFCKQYQCNKSTVIQALQDLENRQVIYAVPRSGYYVLKRTLKPLSAEKGVYDFANAAPDWNEFPYADFQHCIRKAIDAYQQDLFLYGTSKGLLSLVRVVQRQLENTQVFAKEEQIIVTSGVQQALFILQAIAFPNGKEKIVVEQPGYHILIDYINQYGRNAVGIERTAQGIDLNRLEQIFQQGDIKFFYTMPRFHNPLGTSFSKEEKLAIVKLAEKYDVYLVEDDFLADFEQNTKADPLYAYDEHDRVIYLKSYSKIMFPGLRIGIAVVPQALTEAFHQYKKYIDIDSSMISQAALEIYIKSGMFDHHKFKIQAPYIKRSQALNDAIKTYIGETLQAAGYIHQPTLCMHTHIVLDKRVNLNQLLLHAKKRKVIIETADRNYLTGFPRRKIVKLNVSHIAEEQISVGVEKVAEVIKASIFT
ncbi:PLP-dependent aminotransferase family protein [Paenibacillus sp. N3.4]|uniref:aminotransferase-like domain-containing protein n=1 Tax=Paenibacillus sp. N3.4 TaxID=2603222 RepID=UPI0011CA4942|nr:PLP-dependent aminotransferase family protein [Paenibacillus sp. N3.4]TXK76782.1 PLP-dependent aminotransferase family protein [Paenibacillus sp. N3.4]